MRTQLKIKNVSVKRLVSNDTSYQILLEGIEGADLTNEVAELIRLQNEGEYITLTTDDTQSSSNSGPAYSEPRSEEFGSSQ